MKLKDLSPFFFFLAQKISIAKQKQLVLFNRNFFGDWLGELVCESMQGVFDRRSSFYDNSDVKERGEGE